MGATFEGVAAIREFSEDMVGAYEGFDAQIEENVDLGKGIVLAVVNQRGRPAGSSFEARMRYASRQRMGRGLARADHDRTRISTRPVLPPNASPRSGSRRCRRRTWSLPSW